MGKLYAGAAKVCMTPPQEMMPAYFHGNMIFEGVYEDIFLRALVFDNGEQRMAMITYESGDMARMADLRFALERECGLEPQNVCFAAVHNHEAPTFANTHKGVKNNPEKLEWVMRYGDFVIRQTVACVKEAIRNMRPARYSVGVGKSFINVNRDQLFENGLWGQGRDFEGISDKELAVLRFTDSEGKIIGAVINYAVHGTACYQGMDEKQEKYMIAGDLPGMISGYLEERYQDDGAFFLWTCGAAANQNPIFFSQYQRYEHDKSHGLSYSIGYGVWTLCRHLAETQAVDVIGVLENMGEGRDRVHITVVDKKIVLPGQKITYPDEGRVAVMARADTAFCGTVLEGEPVELELKLVTLDDYAFFGLNGELDCGIGMRLKECAPLKNTFIITHTGERAGYLPDKRGYDNHTQEFYASNVKDGCTEEYLIPAAMEMFWQRLAD